MGIDNHRTKGTPMHHHPDLLIQIVHDNHRTRIDAARRHRLARTSVAAQRDTRASGAPSALGRSVPHRRGRVSWRQAERLASSIR
jgi:hypothetical protein